MISRIAIFNNEVFEIKKIDLDTSNLNPTNVLIKQTHIGLNEIDVVDCVNRSETNLGYTACGEVVMTGDKVAWLEKRDKVIYVADKNSICDYKIIDSQKLVKIPIGMSSSFAAAFLYRGCLAHMLTVRAFIVRNGINAIVDNVHTATGTTIGWLAKKRGAFVIGIAPKGFEISKNACDHVIYNDNPDLIDDIYKITNSTGAHVYYSSLNHLEINKIMECLTVSSVIVDHLSIFRTISTNQIMQKSLFFTCPSMMDYKTIKSELILTVEEIRSFINDEKSKISIESSEYSFDKLDDAFSEVKQANSSKAVIIRI